MKKKVDDYDVFGTLISFDEVVPEPKPKTYKAQPHRGGTMSKTNKEGKQGKTSKSKKKGVQRNASVLVPKTYKLPSDLVEQITNVAYWRRWKIQDVIAEAMKVFLEGIPEDEKAIIPHPKHPGHE